MKPPHTRQPTKCTCVVMFLALFLVGFMFAIAMLKHQSSDFWKSAVLKQRNWKLSSKETNTFSKQIDSKDNDESEEKESKNDVQVSQVTPVTPVIPMSPVTAVTRLNETNEHKWNKYDASESWIYGGHLKDMNQLKKEMESTFIYDLKEALKIENREITVIVTACNRLDLLNRTIKSFEKYNNNKQDYKIVQRIITDDCHDHDSAIETIKQYMPQYYLLFSGNNELENTQGNGKDERITRSVDYSMGLVTTPWVIHLEDDWEFYKPGFINAVFDVYTKYVLNYENCLNNSCKLYKYSVVLCREDMCSLKKSKQECDKTRIDWNSYQTYGDTSWRHMGRWNKWNWGGFTFNSGMFPTFIYKKWLGPLQGSKFTHSEGQLSERAIHFGFYVAFLSINSENDAPYCQHIGMGRHEYMEKNGMRKAQQNTKRNGKPNGKPNGKNKGKK